MATSRPLFLLLSLVILNTFELSWEDRPLWPSDQIPENALSPNRAVVRRKILLYHNFMRTKVQPTASDMLLMTWHPEAAKTAQRYAEKCKFMTHSNPSERTVPVLGACGENLFFHSNKVPWFFPIKSWFLEYKNFTYGKPAKDFPAIGHYTQMVWATSHKVGCGVAHCQGGPWGQFYNYVCHYCPAGNFDNQYFYPYKIGTPCADCPGHCVSGHLCNNPCPYVDLYNNCDSLPCDFGGCDATCKCKNKIHKKYPWH